jgi:hypothetical protein
MELVEKKHVVPPVGGTMGYNRPNLWGVLDFSDCDCLYYEDFLVYFQEINESLPLEWHIDNLLLNLKSEHSLLIH